MLAMSTAPSATLQLMSSAMPKAPNSAELEPPGALMPRTPGGAVLLPSIVCGALYPLTENKTAPELGTERQLKTQFVGCVFELKVGSVRYVPPRLAVATLPPC